MDVRERNALLVLDDVKLLQQCRVDCCRGSGRGGQKRNTTESAVRITHLPTGIAATSDKTRSQHSNRSVALQLLRRELAFARRAQSADAYGGPWRPGARTVEYLVWMATVLDILEDRDWRVSDAAAFFGVSTAALVRALRQDEQLWQRVNAGRERHGLKPLRAR